MPITTTALALSAWELIGKPFVEKARDFYSEKALESLSALWEKFTSLTNEDKKALEAVIVDMPEEVRKDETKFQKYIIENITINNQQRSIHTEKYYENITVNGSANFS